MNIFFSKISWVFYRISGVFFKAAWWLEKLVKEKSLNKDEWLQFQNFQKWYSDEGDNNLRVEYPLNQDSIVFDVGGFKGHWAKEIVARYGCKVFVFEPILDYHKLISEIFNCNHLITPLHFGLSGETKNIIFSKDQESSSAFRESKEGNTETCLLKDFNEVINELKVTKIDLLKINIEGGEYELLERIFELNFQNKILNFQIQFHLNISDYQNKIEAIRNVLKQTHECTYSYEFVWENWTLK